MSARNSLKQRHHKGHREQKIIAWNVSYLDCLEKNEVTFDHPEWAGGKIESDIIEDFYLIAKTFSSLTKGEKEKLYYNGDFSFEELVALLKKNGYSDAKEISTKLMELYSQQNQHLEEDIQTKAYE